MFVWRERQDAGTHNPSIPLLSHMVYVFSLLDLGSRNLNSIYESSNLSGFRKISVMPLAEEYSISIKYVTYIAAVSKSVLRGR